MHDMSIWETLYWLVTPLDLVYVVRNDVVWITTADRVDKLPNRVPDEARPGQAQSVFSTSFAGLRTRQACHPTLRRHTRATTSSEQTDTSQLRNCTTVWRGR